MSDKFGYHVRKINRGHVGELSKIREELEELEDAHMQGVRIMALLELSDLVGAIEMYIEKNYPYFNIEDAVKMARLTRRAFESGERQPHKEESEGHS